MIHLYEIDGVLCNDQRIRHLSPLETLVYQSEARVLHRPQHTFSILTGRPKEYTGDTLFWLVRNNVNFSTLFHGNTDPENPNLYKLDILNHLKSRGKEVIYYDSDMKTVEFLRMRGFSAWYMEWRMLERQRKGEIRLTEQVAPDHPFRSKRWG